MLPVFADARSLRAGPGAAASERAEIKPGESARRRILVVDDNRDSADSLASLLAARGNEVRAAYDGSEAVEAVARSRPDVVLLDIAMPRMNGWDAARRIREQPRGNEIILIALTGFGREGDRRLSHEAGFDAHLVKPLYDAELMRVIETLQGRVT